MEVGREESFFLSRKLIRIFECVKTAVEGRLEKGKSKSGTSEKK